MSLTLNFGAVAFRSNATPGDIKRIVHAAGLIWRATYSLKGGGYGLEVRVPHPVTVRQEYVDNLVVKMVAAGMTVSEVKPFVGHPGVFRLHFTLRRS